MGIELTCRVCGQVKEISELAKNRRARLGVSLICMPCDRERVRAYDARNRERRRAKHRERRITHRLRLGLPAIRERTPKPNNPRPPKKEAQRIIAGDGHICWEIPLTKGYKAIIDDCDYPRVSKYQWAVLINASGICYAVRHETVDGKKCAILMHRQIMGVNDGRVVDHKDGCGLNNQRANLRPCDHIRNSYNAKRRSDNTSGFRGVVRARNGQYTAQITSDGVTHHIGQFITSIEAAMAYNEKALELHGEFARLNTIEIGGA